MAKTTDLQIEAITNKLEEKVSRKTRLFILTEISKGEYLLTIVKPGTQNWKATESLLTQMYTNLNLQLGTICKEIGYPAEQWEWMDSKPLEILAKIDEGIETTDWYQRQLGMILQPVDHPWYRVIMT